MSQDLLHSRGRGALIAACVTALMAFAIGCGGGGSSSNNTSSTAFTNGGSNGISNTTSTASTSTSTTSTTSTSSTTGSTSTTTGSTSTTTGTTSGTGSTGGQLNTLHFEDMSAVSWASGTAVTSDARLSNQLVNTLGVRFSSSADYVAVVNVPDNLAPSGTHAIAGVAPNGTVSYSQSNPVWVTFHNPSSPTQKGVVKYFSVTADKQGAPGLRLTIEAYDVSGHLLATYSAPDDDGGEMVYVTADQPVIHRIRILGSANESNGLALDEVTFSTPVRAQ